ncbi:MAG: CHAT domain-containing protein [Thioploca sp.]|nr:CHAT domain-containing protein [Thioploca sp.]
MQAGIEAYQQAVAQTPANSPNLSRHINNLGSGLWTRYARLGKLSDLQSAIEAFQQAVAQTPDDSPELPGHLNNLGECLRTRYACLGQMSDLQAGIEAFQQATQGGEKGSLEEWQRAARNWLNWAFERESWQEMEQAYPSIRETSQQLIEKQLLREHQEAFLRETEGLAVKAAYARIQTGDLPHAVEVLEQGIARLLSAALMRFRADLSQLQQDAPELAATYEEQVKKWQDAQRAYQHAPPEHQKARLQDFEQQRQIFDDLLEQIRQLKGHENFLTVATDINTVYQAAQTTPLVYLFTTAKGGYALVVFQKKIQAIALPKLTETVLREEMERYFDVYNLRSNNFQAWLTVLEEITECLWQVIWQPLYEILSNHQQLTLIPVGLLNLLPLHAAWTPDSTQPTGKRYALDDFTISYAPNALSLQKAKERKFLKPDRLLAIDEPKPVDANSLPSSSIEVKAIAQYFQQSQLYPHQEATLENVKNALNPKYTVLHFSCHGGANLQNPLKTGLLMANNERLTVQDFFDAQLQARLVTLSACETGMIGMKQIEEVVGLPASLLQAGVAGVVASLWSVADITTMLLMVQFYQRWRTQYPDNPAQALRLAQQWVRDSRPSEKTAFLRTILPKAEADELRRKMGMANYTHPYYWAAFTCVGV